LPGRRKDRSGIPATSRKWPFFRLPDATPHRLRAPFARARSGDAQSNRTNALVVTWFSSNGNHTLTGMAE
jgi:hypothetical protein